jgi:unspecific monooxygenase
MVDDVEAKRDAKAIAGEQLPRPSWRLPVIGDVLRLDAKRPVQREARWASTLGSVFEIKILADRLVVVGGADVAAEVFDEERFAKAVVAPLTSLRAIAGDGLFTAFNSEPNWARAHNVLAPAFSQESMRSYHQIMVSAVSELITDWRASTAAPVAVPADMNALTLNIIGRAGFGYDFGGIGGGADPFVQAMTRALSYASTSSNEVPFLRALFGRAATRQYPKDVALLHSVVDGVIMQRRNGTRAPSNDLLQRMLDTPDPESGEMLPDENIRNQVLTFLIAGHETTAGTLSFALHYLSLNPDVVATARAEIDRVWPDPSVELTFEQVGKLRYVRRIVDETLRLWPSGPAFFRKARRDTTLAGKYAVKKGHPILVVLLALHRDKAVWGEDAELFDPDRFAPAAMKARAGHVHAYKPFGTGVRGCIGRQFAVHEAVLALAMLLRAFDFKPVPGYELKVDELMTIRPAGLTLTLSERTTVGDAPMS